MVMRSCLCLLFGCSLLLAAQSRPQQTPSTAIPLQQALKRALPFPFSVQVGETGGSAWTPAVSLPRLPGPAQMGSGVSESCAIPLTRVPVPTDRTFSMNKIPSRGKTLDRMTKQPPVKTCEETASARTPR